ncbi:MAG: MBL fold metallo-hydrolase [Sphingobacteriaceae bacterium]|nr:MBL fold metallo-hydrolase [Sphingobacteriaceae bacterium]
MYIEQIYTNCLSQAAYYVESDGEAVVIDPLRDPQPYLDLAKKRNSRIKYVFETHFHADFVSGHLDLSRKTGAVIVFGPNAKPAYQALIAFDGEEFTLGSIIIKVIHTPGHTLESSCFLVIDESGKENAIFTGDTLFVGDVGRPDLLSGNLDKTTLTEMLFDSLKFKIKTLPADVIVYPGHGAGSACGKNLGKETSTTIGEQMEKNYALKETNKDAFVQAVTSGLSKPPAYFFKDASININGYESIDKVIKSAATELNPEMLLNEVKNGCVILDTRDAEEFAEKFIPGSINIGLNGQFANWVGTLLEFNAPVILVTEIGKEKESAMRLSRIGYDNIKGFLKEGIESWVKAGHSCDSIQSITYEKYCNDSQVVDFLVLDVRMDNERNEMQFPNSLNIPLQVFQETISSLDRFKPVFVYCAGGYRSMMAASLLKKNNFGIVCNLKGGINAYKDKAPELMFR